MNHTIIVLILSSLVGVITANQRVTFMELLSDHCMRNQSSDHVTSVVVGPAGPRGRNGPMGPRGLPGSVNETTVRKIVEEEISSVLPVFRNISELLVGKELAKEYMARFHSEEEWTVFQRRMDGSVNFTRNWHDYVTGFGNPNGEFWLGLEKLHLLTRSAVYQMRIDMVERDGTYYQANYKFFEVGPSSNNYKLRLSGFSGNSTDSMVKSGWLDGGLANNQEFSTFDADHDKRDCANCAESFKGGWGFDNCYYANLNGLYYDLGSAGIVWSKMYQNTDYYMRFTEMKVRRRA